VPIYSTINTTYDPIEAASCSFAFKVMVARYQNYARFGAYDGAEFLVEALKPKFKTFFNLNESVIANMTVNQASRYADVVLAQSFEGVPTNFTWTEEDRAMLELLETYHLVMGYTPTARKLATSNLFMEAFKDIKSLTGYTGPSTPPSILFYSGHDTQVANILLQLMPSFNFTYIPYSSSIRLELY
jgi:hypothetical protein